MERRAVISNADAGSGPRMRHTTLMLGRRDRPTDGVLDYCRRLAAALSATGHSVDITEFYLRWSVAAHDGGPRTSWRPVSLGPKDVVVLQYTHIGWSRRGFPLASVWAAHRVR